MSLSFSVEQLEALLADARRREGNVAGSTAVAAAPVANQFAGPPASAARPMADDTGHRTANAWPFGENSGPSAAEPESPVLPPPRPTQHHYAPSTPSRNGSMGNGILTAVGPPQRAVVESSPDVVVTGHAKLARRFDQAAVQRASGFGIKKGGKSGHSRQVLKPATPSLTTPSDEASASGGAENRAANKFGSRKVQFGTKDLLAVVPSQLHNKWFFTPSPIGLRAVLATCEKLGLVTKPQMRRDTPPVGVHDLVLEEFGDFDWLKLRVNDSLPTYHWLYVTSGGQVARIPSRRMMGGEELHSWYAGSNKNICGMIQAREGVNLYIWDEEYDAQKRVLLEEAREMAGRAGRKSEEYKITDEEWDLLREWDEEAARSKADAEAEKKKLKAEREDEPEEDEEQEEQEVDSDMGEETDGDEERDGSVTIDGDEVSRRKAKEISRCPHCRSTMGGVSLHRHMPACPKRPCVKVKIEPGLDEGHSKPASKDASRPAAGKQKKKSPAQVIEISDTDVETPRKPRPKSRSKLLSVSPPQPLQHLPRTTRTAQKAIAPLEVSREVLDSLGLVPMPGIDSPSVHTVPSSDPPPSSAPSSSVVGAALRDRSSVTPTPAPKVAAPEEGNRRTTRSSSRDLGTAKTSVSEAAPSGKRTASGRMKSAGPEVIREEVGQEADKNEE